MRTLLIKTSTENVVVAIYLLYIGETFKTYDHIENIWIEITLQFYRASDYGFLSVALNTKKIE